MVIITQGVYGEKHKIGENRSFRTLLLPPLLLLLGAMLLRPELTVTAAKGGLTLWAGAVVPSLLPFFILSELLVAAGAARAAGRLLSPLMRPLFDLPGAAALGLVMGFCSGFPTGAAVAAALRRQGLITAEEGGRLAAFTNNAGPLYLTVTVASALLDLPQAAWLLAAGHYGVNMLLGVALGLVSRHSGRPRLAASPLTERMTQPDSGPASPPAPMMKAAAQRAAANLILIGCYMTFFSVAAAQLTPGPGVSPLLRFFLSGVWEMTLGLNALSGSGLELGLLLPLAAAQLALGGLSVQLQVLSLLADTDISPRLYLLSRPVHAVLAALFTRWALGRAALPLTAGGAVPAGGTVTLLSSRTLLSHSLALTGAAALFFLLAARLSRRG